MLIIPIGVERSAVRRLPWVTFGILILCAAVFVPTRLAPAVSERQVAERFEQAVRYYMEHPYLEAPVELKELVLEPVRKREQEAFQEVLKEFGHRAEKSARDIPAEQKRLESLWAAALEAREREPLRRYGLIPARWRLVTLISHMFLHAGWLHLIGNMLILYLTGPFVEDRYGRPLFAALYLGSGLGAAMLQIAAQPDAELPMIGASGAIAGVMGAFLVRYAWTRIQFFYVFGVWARGTFWAPAWTMIGLWFVEQVFLGSLTTAETAGIAYWAHVGGFLFGVAAALAIKFGRIEERFLAARIERKTETEVLRNGPLEDALSAHAAGRTEEAWRALLALTLHHPDDRDAAIALWRLAVELDRVPQAATTMLRAIDSAARAGEADLACAQWSELTELVPEPPATPVQLIRIAGLLAGHQLGGSARRALEQALHRPGDALTPAMALRIAALARNLDARLAERAARRVLEMPAAQPAEIDAARKTLSELARERGALAP